MKKIVFTLLILSVMSFKTMAQDEEDGELSSITSAFMDYCVRAANAAADCDVETLAACIENWEPGEYDSEGNTLKAEVLTYDDEEITYINFGKLDCIDCSSESIVGMHFGFTPQAVDNWITNQCEPTLVADAHALRAGEEAVELEFSVRALKPNSKATYTTDGTGDVEMFVVAEKGGNIKLSIHSIENPDRDGNIKETTLADNSGGQTAQLAWSMYRNGAIEFTIENASDKETSFIVVKKM
ncbi:MAG: hypothetical protein IKQ30_14280 [Bacteroidales bacterium]|nr:hypothetical protein [Bacteroidales bacterium]